MGTEWRGRLEHWERTLKNDLYRPLGIVEFEGCTTMDHIALDDAKHLSYQPMPVGTCWGQTYEYCWLRSKIQLPKEAEGKRIAVNLVTGGEATIFVNGQAFGTYRSNWVRIPHHYIVDNFLTKEGKYGQEFEVYLEAYAGHFIAESPNGGCATGPVMPGSYQDTKTEGQRACIGKSTYGIWNEEAFQLLIDVQVLTQLLDQIDPESLRADKIATALEQYTLTVDFEQDQEGRNQDYHMAREILHPVLKAINGSTTPEFYAIGNAHLDLAWLWPMAETHRKTARTFAAQLRLLDEYPDYVFLQSQPASYEMCRKYYPELFEKVKKAVKDGRWIADGAMYVEPDTNMAGGEALIRQLLYGKKYFREVFDVDSQLLWLPDTFGYSAALPQILKGCGVKYLVTQKIFWSYNGGERFPYHYFTWQGADGSKIVSFLPTSYTYRTDPSEICGAWNDRAQKRKLNAFLLPYGYGDGGGGPCRDYIEMVNREKNLEGMPRVRHASPMTFFKDMEKMGGPQHTYVGELYFSAHRGVYTTQAKVKKGNRKGEIILREAEIWGSLAQQYSYTFPHVQIENNWKRILVNQFHDILPGSSIDRVHIEACKIYDEVLEDTDIIISEATRTFIDGKNGVSFLNSLSFARERVMKLPGNFTQGAKTQNNKVLLTQKTENGLLALVPMPAMGLVSLLPTDEIAQFESVRAITDKTGVLLENQLVKIKLNTRGEVISFVDKATDQEYAAGPMNRFLMYKDVPRLFDNWDIDSHYEVQPVDINEPVKLTVMEEGGLRAIIHLERKLLSSTLTQNIVLDYNSRRLDFITHVEWAEMHRLLKVSFPVNIQATEGINEIQYGYVKRPTHRSRLYDSDRFEVCNQRYTALVDQGRGAAVLNDCKYGISMHDNDLRLSLLRGGTCPEMGTDQGSHDFTYSFTAWEGSFLDAPVVHEAYDLNVPPLTIAGNGPDFSAFEIDASNVFIDAVKPAVDQSDDLIVRLFEAKRADTSCILTINLPNSEVYLCDMLENPLEKLKVENNSVKLRFGTFEVKTIRIKQ